MNQFNSDGSDPDGRAADMEEGMLVVGLGIVALVFVISVVVGLVCGLRAAGWI